MLCFSFLGSESRVEKRRHERKQYFKRAILIGNTSLTAILSNQSMHSSFHFFMFQTSTIHIHSSIQPCSPVAGGGLSGRAPAALAKCHVNILCSYSTGYDKIHLKSHHFANDSVTFFLLFALFRQLCMAACQRQQVSWRPQRS